MSYFLIERAYPDEVKIGDKGNSNQFSLKAGANDIYIIFSLNLLVLTILFLCYEAHIQV